MHNPTKPSRTNAKKDNPTKKGGAGSRHPTPPERNERDVSLTTVKFYWVVVGYVMGLVLGLHSLDLVLTAEVSQVHHVQRSALEHVALVLFVSRYGAYVLLGSITPCGWR